MNGSRLCQACYSFIGLTSGTSIKFKGILFATGSEARTWVAKDEDSWHGPDLSKKNIYIGDDFFASAFSFLLNYKYSQPYIFAVKNNPKTSFALSDFTVNHDPDLIIFSGPTQPVTMGRDPRTMLRSRIAALQRTNAWDISTGEGRFLEVSNGRRKAWSL